jgi:hypothetical protein
MSLPVVIFITSRMPPPLHALKFLFGQETVFVHISLGQSNCLGSNLQQVDAQPTSRSRLCLNIAQLVASQYSHRLLSGQHSLRRGGWKLHSGPWQATSWGSPKHAAVQDLLRPDVAFAEQQEHQL